MIGKHDPVHHLGLKALFFASFKTFFCHSVSTVISVNLKSPSYSAVVTDFLKTEVVSRHPVFRVTHDVPHHACPCALVSIGCHEYGLCPLQVPADLPPW